MPPRDGLHVEARIEGLREVERRLGELSREYGPKNARGVYTRLLGRILRPYRIDLFAVTPVVSGSLRQSVGVRVGKGRDVTAQGLLGWQGLRGGATSARRQQALAVEAGTPRRIPGDQGQRILADLFRRLCPSWERQVSSGLGAELERTAARLARRRAAGTLRRR